MIAKVLLQRMIWLQRMILLQRMIWLQRMILAEWPAVVRDQTGRAGGRRLRRAMPPGPAGAFAHA
jgi:hypothetical protein